VQPVTFALVHEGHCEWAEAGDLAQLRSSVTWALQLRDSAGLRSHFCERHRLPPSIPLHPGAGNLNRVDSIAKQYSMPAAKPQITRAPSRGRLSLEAPKMEHGPSRDRLPVGAMHSERARSVRVIFHQKHDIPRTQPGEECVALFGGGFLPYVSGHL